MVIDKKGSSGYGYSIFDTFEAGGKGNMELFYFFVFW